MKKIGIVGSGIAGLLTAFRLLGTARITIFHIKDDPEEASIAANGIVSSKGLILPESELFKLKLQGHNVFTQWFERYQSIVVGIFQTTG